MLDYMNTSLGLNFDGIWLDVNEVTNDCNGYCKDSQRPENLGMKNSKHFPIYVPGSRDLDDKVIGLDALHANGETEYSMHNLYAFH